MSIAYLSTVNWFIYLSTDLKNAACQAAQGTTLSAVACHDPAPVNTYT
ncbi:MAG: hypothetical protein HYZ44_08250 [Bacteroidetes bacterium]|nr:hypothetical protein [Bacteroidota bacterium]